MKQQTFSDIEYSNHMKRPNEKNSLMPWRHASMGLLGNWVKLLRPYYPSRKQGQSPKNWGHALHVPYAKPVQSFGCRNRRYHKQLCYAQLHASWISHGAGAGCHNPPSFPLSDQEEQVWRKDFANVNTRLEKAGLMIHRGTIIDATIISAPISTKD